MHAASSGHDVHMNKAKFALHCVDSSTRSADALDPRPLMSDSRKPDVNLGGYEGVSWPTAFGSTSSSASCASDSGSLKSLFSSRICISTPCPLVLSTYTILQVTVLCIDIQGFTAACAAMSASRVGIWVVDFYTRVRAVAAMHGVSTVEARGDSCVCVAGAEGVIPSPTMASAAADPQHDQAIRMLAFAAALHDNLHTLSAGVGANIATATRMGIATGEASFLVSAATSRTRFASVQGEALGAATRMEALAGSGAVYVHRSTAHKWAAETWRPPPPSVRVACAGWGMQRAAVYDCATRAFLPIAACGGGSDASAMTGCRGSLHWGAGFSDLRRSASAP
jgi:class 3 adenylate cyclase